MKHIATVALMLNLGVASVYAQEKPVKMVISGTAAPSTINLQTGTGTTEYSLAGNGTLGPFTLRAVSGGTASPQESSTCPSPKLYFPTIAGGGVFRFRDGSLLKVHLTEGSDCIDLAAQEALCIRTFQVTGGTTLRAPGTQRIASAQDQQGVGFDRDLRLPCHHSHACLPTTSPFGSALVRKQGGSLPQRRVNSPYKPHDNF